MGANYSDIILWAVFLFLGYFGFGEFLVRSLKRPEFMDLGWASKVALGMCITIFLGSALMVFKLATAVGLVSIAAMGFCLAVFYIGQEFLKPLPDSKSKRGSKLGLEKKSDFGWLYLSIPAAFALLTFGTSIYWPFQYDPNDDWVAYLTFPERILQTGTLIEPFSQRRIFSLCGQSILLAQIMVVAAPESAHLLDRGFGTLILFGVIMEATRNTAKTWQWVRALLLLTAVTISVPRINTSSSVLGVCMMFCFFQFSIRAVQLLPNWILWIIPSLVLAGASSLRFTYALTCSGVLVGFLAWRIVSSSFKSWFQNLCHLLFSGLLTFGFLLPLMFVSWESSGTPIYPPFVGNGVPDFFYSSTNMGFLQDAKVALQLMLIPEMSLFLITFPVLYFTKSDRAHFCLVIAIVVVILVFIAGVKSSGNAATWTMDFYRFGFPLYAVAFFWILTSVLENPKSRSYLHPQVMAFCSLFLISLTQIQPAMKEAHEKISVIQLQSNGFQFSASKLKPLYDELQNRTREGDPIFAVVDAPYLLNYKRNPIANVDNIGAASPPPHIPFHQGPKAVRDYLKKAGYKYLLAVDFNKAVFLYNKNVMSNHPRVEFRDFSKKYVLDFLNNVDHIASDNLIDSNINARLAELDD
jgi:hypothetical protein